MSPIEPRWSTHRLTPGGRECDSFVVFGFELAGRCRPESDGSARANRSTGGRSPSDWWGRSVLYFSTQASRACLGLVDGGVPAVVVDEELVPIGPVEALHLARRGRRVRGGQAVLDAVVVADPVEEHRSWSWAESSGEDLAVVGEDLVGGTVCAAGRR